MRIRPGKRRLAVNYRFQIEPNSEYRTIHSMRHLLVALVIVLLPLRGMMGDAMAISMAGMQMGAGTPTHAMATPGMAHGMAPQSMQDAHQAATPASEYEDCADMPMAAAAPEPSGESQGTMAGCESCSICQVCGSAAMAPDAQRSASLPLPQVSPLGTLPHCASASLQRGHKPPIS